MSRPSPLINKDAEIGEILELAGFQIFPAGANKDRLKAKQQIIDLINREVLAGRINELRKLMIDTDAPILLSRINQLEAEYNAEYGKPTTTRTTGGKDEQE